MACRTVWHSTQDINIGSVMSYAAKDDIRSGLFVELLHGDLWFCGRYFGIDCQSVNQLINQPINQSIGLGY